jgi:hypothetical protein
MHSNRRRCVVTVDVTLPEATLAAPRKAMRQYLHGKPRKRGGQNNPPLRHPRRGRRARARGLSNTMRSDGVTALPAVFLGHVHGCEAPRGAD